MQNNINNTKVVISGINGRIGKNIIKLIKKQSKIELVSGITRNLSFLNKNLISELKQNNNFSIIDNIKKIKHDFDVLIDFTVPKNTLKNLSYCVKNNKMLVIGTTGFNETEKSIIKDASNNIGIVFTPNFSIGINLITKIVVKLTKILKYKYDIEILESHHRNKLDAPSGTALMIGEKIAKTMKCDLKNNAIYNRKNNNKKRKKNDIGFSVIRAGNIIGEHNIMFVNNNEKIMITHQAFNRKIFAEGALNASLWLNKHKKIGLYNINDVLNLSDF